jgi:hypothetical protein
VRAKGASMNRLSGLLLASLAIAAAWPAAGQSGVRMEIGAQICGPDPLSDESKDEFDQRIAREQNTPDWIWTALEAMQDAPEKMTFTLKKVNGERVLFANGGVDDDAAANLRAALRANAPVSEVWLNSPGGNSQVGVQMGDMLRQQQLTTRVRAGNGCASACSTAFLGGWMRKVEPGAAYGVHMYSTTLSEGGAKDIRQRSQGGKDSAQQLYNEIQWQGAKGAADRVQYVQRMGVSVHWLDIWSGTRPGCMTFMSQDELKRVFVNNIE